MGNEQPKRRSTNGILGFNGANMPHEPSEQDASDSQLAEELLPIVYNELRQVAKSKLSHEQPGQTLQPTALVHEAFLRLVDREELQQWNNPRHFFSAAAESMRRILIERARRKATQKRGGGLTRRELTDDTALPMRCDDLLGLDEALQKLEIQDARKAQVVKLRFFAGLSVAEAAKVLGVSKSAAECDWAYSRSWLRMAMAADDE